MLSNAFLLCLLLTSSVSALIGGGYEQMTNVILRFTPFEPSYLFPYLARRLSFRRLKDPIIKKLESAPLIKY
ncbi:hypothetical protein OESDEN_13154 [Oesophagostomum dentatum]|uniref:Secreted protein n=1 Tax=Oesophagostomum dentatum TaxID=61180 RepID=A0A0B1SV66_OESDE|nr:hypothetical protein OESDEN_13154 [Oesophagostomum dentatum]